VAAQTTTEDDTSWARTNLVLLDSDTMTPPRQSLEQDAVLQISRRPPADLEAERLRRGRAADRLGAARPSPGYSQPSPASPRLTVMIRPIS
jgi:hypothetical protein